VIVREATPGGAMNALLSISGLTKSYGSRLAIEAIGFELWPGEVLAVVGESGSGKTTLLNCISGRLAPDAGRVEYLTRHEGVRDVYAMSEAERRMLARTDWGYVHQSPEQGLRMNVSAGANVGERLMALGARHYGRIRGEAAQWLARVEMDAARIDEPPTAFSGGMRQRLQIARALAIEPEILLMDEPFAALDALTRRKMHSFLLGIWERTKKTIVFVTHDISESILMADRIAVMTVGPYARLKQVLRVDLPRPRDPAEPAFGELYGRIERLLEEEIARVPEEAV
jgi:putative phosphonate transport system ATP-binding protein